MTQEERIIKKVYDAKKVELGEYKIDLANVNELFTESERVLKIFKDKTEKIKKSISLALDGYNDFSGNKSQIESLTNDWVNSIKQIKELGVNVDPKYLKISNQLDALNNIKIAKLRQYLFEAYNHPIITINK